VRQPRHSMILSRMRTPYLQAAPCLFRATGAQQCAGQCDLQDIPLGPAASDPFVVCHHPGQFPDCRIRPVTGKRLETTGQRRNNRTCRPFRPVDDPLQALWLSGHGVCQRRMYISKSKPGIRKDPVGEITDLLPPVPRYVHPRSRGTKQKRRTVGHHIQRRRGGPVRCDTSPENLPHSTGIPPCKRPEGDVPAYVAVQIGRFRVVRTEMVDIPKPGISFTVFIIQMRPHMGAVGTVRFQFQRPFDVCSSRAGLSGFHLGKGVLTQEPPVVPEVRRKQCCISQLFRLASRISGKSDQTKNTRTALGHQDVGRMVSYMLPYPVAGLLRPPFDHVSQYVNLRRFTRRNTSQQLPGGRELCPGPGATSADLMHTRQPDPRHGKAVICCNGFVKSTLHIVACRSGHRLNGDLVRVLLEQAQEESCRKSA